MNMVRPQFIKKVSETIKNNNSLLIAEFPYIKKMDSNNLDILWKELDIKNKLISLLNSKIS